jgi:SAM-dependent methyltransferase
VVRTLVKKLRSVVRENKPKRRAYTAKQRGILEKFRKELPSFDFVEEFADRSSASSHGTSPELIQFWHASTEVSNIGAKTILDIGSHLSWLTGVGAGIKLKTVDVREKTLKLPTEEFFIGTAENLPFKDSSENCITSLCALEHFGLGSYGDPIGIDADLRAIAEVKRVLNKGGSYIFSTTITGRKRPYIVFNTRRVYTVDFLHEVLRKDFELVEERFFSMKERALIKKNALGKEIGQYEFDLYLGHWRKI